MVCEPEPQTAIDFLTTEETDSDIVAGGPKFQEPEKAAGSSRRAAASIK